MSHQTNGVWPGCGRWSELVELKTSLASAEIEKVWIYPPMGARLFLAWGGQVRKVWEGGWRRAEERGRRDHSSSQHEERVTFLAPIGISQIPFDHVVWLWLAAAAAAKRKNKKKKKTWRKSFVQSFSGRTTEWWRWSIPVVHQFGAKQRRQKTAAPPTV